MSVVVLPPARLYWRIQFVAWTLYAGINVVFFQVFAPALGLRWAVVTAGCISATTLLASHALRWVLLRRQWLMRPLPGLLWRLLLANAALAVVSEVAIQLVVRFGLRPAVVSNAAGGHWGELLGYTINLNILLWLWAAAYVGWHYLQRSRRAEVAQWQLAAAVREAELNTLRAQLNPHFLFNGLNNIRSLVSEDPARARQALAHLAALLRYVMQHSRTPLVPLAQEMEIVADYLQLEALQLEDRLHYTLDVDPAAGSLLLPPLTVQLLVENAIKHGLAQRPAGGTVRVAGQLDEAGFLCLTVRNTGHYAPPAEVAAPAPGPAEAPGLGLRTLRERLAQAFGPAATFELQNDPAVADTVLATLRLPGLIA